MEKKLLERQAKRKEAIKKAGIEYDFEGYVSCSMLDMALATQRC